MKRTGFAAERIGVKYVFIIVAGTPPLYFSTTIQIVHRFGGYCESYWHTTPQASRPFGRVPEPTCSLVYFCRETYSPVLRLRIAKKSADPEKTAKMHPVLLAEHTSKLHYLWINLSRPAVLLFGSFVCSMLSLYMAL
jgi:hypothetical protein